MGETTNLNWWSPDFSQIPVSSCFWRLPGVVWKQHCWWLKPWICPSKWSRASARSWRFGEGVGSGHGKTRDIFSFQRWQRWGTTTDSPIKDWTVCFIVISCFDACNMNATVRELDTFLHDLTIKYGQTLQDLQASNLPGLPSRVSGHRSTAATLWVQKLSWRVTWYLEVRWNLPIQPFDSYVKHLQRFEILEGGSLKDMFSQPLRNKNSGKHTVRCGTVDV